MRPCHTYVHTQCTVHASATHVCIVGVATATSAKLRLERRACQHIRAHMCADTHNGRYRRLAQKHWLQGQKQRRASQSPERRLSNPLGSQGPGALTSPTPHGNQMHEAHKMLLRELKAYSPSPDEIERMALAVQRTSQEVVAALRADAILNDTTGANADIPAFAFLLADAEYHEAVVQRVLQVYTHTQTHTHTLTHIMRLWCVCCRARGKRRLR